MDIKTIGTIAYMIVMVFYGVYTMVLSIQAYSRFSDTSERYNNIAANLKEAPIIDVKSMKTSQCEAGYTSLFYWNWKGMSSGCDCTTSTNVKVQKKVYTNSCNSTFISYSCKTLDAIPATPFNFFQSPINTKSNICVKKGSTSLSFYKQAAKLNGVCQSGQKLCGNPSAKETVYCVGLSDPCPVYDIQFSTTLNDPKYPLTSYTMVTVDGGYLYYDQKGTTATTLPLSQLRLTQGSGVCDVNNNAMVLPPGQTDYVLSLSNRTSCSSFDTTFVTQNFKTAENKYYEVNLNPVDYNKMKNFPNIKIPTSTENFQTFQRAYLKWAISSRDLIKDFVDASDSLNNLKSAQLTVMIINIFVCIMVSIILQISQVYNLMGKDVPCIDGKGEEEKKRIVRIKKILAYGSKLLQAPFLLWAFIVSAQKKGIIRDVADASPMEAQFNGQVLTFAKQIEDDVFKKNLAALIVLLLTVLLDVALLLRAQYCAKKKEGTVEPAKIDEENKPVNQSQFPNNNQTIDPQFAAQPGMIPMQPIQPGYTPMQPGVVQPGMAPMQPGVVYQQQPGVVYQQQPGVVYQQQPGVVYQQQPGVVYVQPAQQIQPVVVVAQPMY